MTRLHYLIITLIIVTVSPIASQAGKPPPPPPPPPPPTSCSGTFPAFAYTKDLFRRQGQRQIRASSDLYLANSNGTCSIKIANSAVPIDAVFYRQNGANGRIIFSTMTGLGMVNFGVAAGAVTNSLPLAISNVYVSAAYHAVALSKNAQTIYLVDEVRNANGDWIDYIRTVNISSCSSNCAAQMLYTFPLGITPYHLSVNDAEDRLYMSVHDFNSGHSAISFMQKTEGVWSTSSRDVVSNVDYETGGFGKLANGTWDFDGDVSHSQNDVLAAHVDGVIQVFDVTNCAAEAAFGESCISSGESTVVPTGGIAGELNGFRSANLIVRTGNVPGDVPAMFDEVKLCRLDEVNCTLERTHLVEAITADSAD